MKITPMKDDLELSKVEYLSNNSNEDTKPNKYFKWKQLYMEDDLKI